MLNLNLLDKTILQTKISYHLIIILYRNHYYLSISFSTQIYIKMASESDPQTVEGEKDQLYYITKAKEKLRICLMNADHSPEFKQTLMEQLQELTSQTTPTPAVVPKVSPSSLSAISAVQQKKVGGAGINKPVAQKSLSFQSTDSAMGELRYSDTIAHKDEDDDDEVVASMLDHNGGIAAGDVSSMLEKSLLQEQLDAKEHENHSLKQALAMYRAQIEMQRQHPTPMGGQPYMHYQQQQQYIQYQQQQMMMMAMMNAQHQQSPHQLPAHYQQQEQQMHSPMTAPSAQPQPPQQGEQEESQTVAASAAQPQPPLPLTDTSVSQLQQRHVAPQQQPPPTQPSVAPPLSHQPPPPLSHQQPPPQYPLAANQVQAAVLPQHMRQLSNSSMQTPPLMPASTNGLPVMQHPPQHPMQNWPRPGAYPMSNPMTPTVMTGGMETPSDLWWDSFSPQPSFEKGYFAGLAQHVEQVREESGEGEAPTLRDPASEDPAVDSTVDGVPQQYVQLGGTTPIQQQQQLAVGNNGEFAKKMDGTPTTVTSGVSSQSVIVLTPKSPAALEPDDIYVEPIIKLEAGKLEDLTTGEEEEQPRFVHRAKLYRFDKELSQWKERGVGDVKLLFNERTRKARITMRRDQVFRVCCNHAIVPDMELKRMKSEAQNAWSWFTPMDATEETPRAESFTIKFKNQEIADKFREAFELCQRLVADDNVEQEESLPAAAAIPVVVTDEKTSSNAEKPQNPG